MRSLTESAHLFRQCRSQLRTMFFDFPLCCFIDHLHCCLSLRAHRIHSLIHHLFMLRALLPRTTLLPSYPRNLTRTHLQINPPAFHPSRRSFQFRLILATVFLVLLLIILLAFLFFALIPPSFVQQALLPAAFFLSAVFYICLLRFCMAIR